jgi:hypothetical protein
VGSLVKSAGQPDAGKPHVRLEEGAPVGRPWRDTQALPTERGSNGYGPPYSPTRPGPTLQSSYQLSEPSHQIGDLTHAEGRTGRVPHRLAWCCLPG